jgi:hypothetical protein
VTRRKRGPIRVVLGFVLLVGGLIVLGTGIVAVVKERDRIEEEAVARGKLSETVKFRAATAREYQVYVIFGGRISDTEAQDQAIGETACAVSTGERFSGSRQGTSITIGQASTIGTFSAPAGAITVACTGPDAEDYVVTPSGEPPMRNFATIGVGGLAAVLGLVLFIGGLIGRRVRI